MTCVWSLLAWLREREPDILAANARDVEAARSAGQDSARLDRLTLTPAIMEEMRAACAHVANLPDPVGATESQWQRPNGLLVGKMRIPLGVIAMIYEARPNVTADAAALCLKSGNAVILRGGSEAIRSNTVISSLLAKAAYENGIPEGALQFVSNPELVSRTHFARFLVETRVCRDTAEVFRKYLVEGKPGYVPHRWAALGDAVRWITEAGGVAVIAHPARYKLTANEEYALFSEFKAHGGQGVEVVTGSHSAAEYVTYGAMAHEFGLAASRGSDFHSPDESQIDLGQLPYLPSQLTPVWELLQNRIQRA